MLRDLLRLRERQLYWWVGKWPLLLTGVLAGVALVFSAVRIANVAAAGESQGVAWRAFASTAWACSSFLVLGSCAFGSCVGKW